MNTTLLCTKCSYLANSLTESETACPTCLLDDPTPAAIAADNPYQSPEVVETAEEEKPQRPKVSIFTAERPDRFFAKMLDVMPLWILQIGAIGFLHESALNALIAYWVITLAWLTVQSISMAVTGQSIGKQLLRLKVVNHRDGGQPGFVMAVLVRWWVPLFILNFLAPIPFVFLGMSAGEIGVMMILTWLFDAAFIFRKDRRCLHDLLGGTKVMTVIASRKRSAAE